MNISSRLPRLRRAAPALGAFTALLFTPVFAAEATPPTPAAAPAPQVTAESLKPALPMDFDKFAADYQPKSISPPWMVLQIGTLETYFAPPAGKPAFVLPERDFSEQLKASYHPIELNCLMGAKTRFDNVTLLTLDKAGNPLGYTLPLGKIVYFLARNDSDSGIIFSLHYYDSGKDLYWIDNPAKPGAFIPVIRPTSVTQELGAPAESYTFLYLSQRVGQLRPDSTAKPLPLFTYLVIRIHRVPPPAAPTGLAGGS
ncbi:MAG TPA: hypothetical protein VHC95_11335 [Opitutales bacterium]|nr:hypothetical protein [Opitutales bacterium]